MLKFMGWPPMGTPVVPCSDFSGVVHSVGSGVSMWKVGDEVFGVKFLSSEVPTPSCSNTVHPL
jgi:NADPH:quinone reductase-like Zn-dependent oxidoreductase